MWEAAPDALSDLRRLMEQGEGIALAISDADSIGGSASGMTGAARELLNGATALWSFLLLAKTAAASVKGIQR